MYKEVNGFGCPKLQLFYNMTQIFFNNMKKMITFAFNKTLIK